VQIPQRCHRIATASVLNRSCLYLFRQGAGALQNMADGGLLDEGLQIICAQARRTSMCLLPVLLPIIKAATEEVGEPPAVVPRETPEVRLIGEVPSYALDGFTRVGQWALGD